MPLKLSNSSTCLYETVYHCVGGLECYEKPHVLVFNLGRLWLLEPQSWRHPKSSIRNSSVEMSNNRTQRLWTCDALRHDAEGNQIDSCPSVYRNHISSRVGWSLSRQMEPRHFLHSQKRPFTTGPNPENNFSLCRGWDERLQNLGMTPWYAMLCPDDSASQSSDQTSIAMR